MSAPHRPVPDTLPACQAYCRELIAEVLHEQRRLAQVAAELATERNRWAQLKADAADADRQGHGIDTVGFMRRLEQATE